VLVTLGSMGLVVRSSQITLERYTMMSVVLNATDAGDQRSPIASSASSTLQRTHSQHASVTLCGQEMTAVLAQLTMLACVVLSVWKDLDVMVPTTETVYAVLIIHM